MVRSWKGLRKVHGMEGKKGKFKAGRWVVYRQFSFATRFPGSVPLCSRVLSFSISARYYVSQCPCLPPSVFNLLPLNRLPIISFLFSLFSFSCVSPFPRTLFSIQPSFSFSWSPLVTFSRSPVLVIPYSITKKPAKQLLVVLKIWLYLSNRTFLVTTAKSKFHLSRHVYTYRSKLVVART